MGVSKVRVVGVTTERCVFAKNVNRVSLEDIVEGYLGTSAKMIRPLGLFKQAVDRFKKINSARKLYTDTIYPYPYRYFNETVFPSRYQYRETFITAPWQASHVKLNKYLWRIFWTYWWYMAFSRPETFTGHFHPPNPSTWTDEELGIPPLDEVPYEEWKKNREAQKE